MARFEVDQGILTVGVMGEEMLKRNDISKWIESDGGPLVLIPRSLLLDWHGNSQRKLDRNTDYDRACSVDSEIGVIGLSGRDILVFGDEPDRTCMFICSPHFFLVIRWRWARSESDLLSKIDVDDIKNIPLKRRGFLDVISDEYVLFDSAFSGNEVVDFLSIPLSSGVVCFDTIECKPDSSTCAVIHRFWVNGI